MYLYRAESVLSTLVPKLCENDEYEFLVMKEGVTIDDVLAKAGGKSKRGTKGKKSETQLPSRQNYTRTLSASADRSSSSTTDLAQSDGAIIMAEAEATVEQATAQPQEEAPLTLPIAQTSRPLTPGIHIASLPPGSQLATPILAAVPEAEQVRPNLEVTQYPLQKNKKLHAVAVSGGFRGTTTTPASTPVPVEVHAPVLLNSLNPLHALGVQGGLVGSSYLNTFQPSSTVPPPPGMEQHTLNHSAAGFEPGSETPAEAEPLPETPRDEHQQIQKGDPQSRQEARQAEMKQPPSQPIPSLSTDPQQKAPTPSQKMPDSITPPQHSSPSSSQQNRPSSPDSAPDARISPMTEPTNLIPAVEPSSPHLESAPAPSVLTSPPFNLGAANSPSRQQTSTSSRQTSDTAFASGTGRHDHGGDASSSSRSVIGDAQRSEKEERFVDVGDAISSSRNAISDAQRSGAGQGAERGKHSAVGRANGTMSMEEKARQIQWSIDGQSHIIGEEMGSGKGDGAGGFDIPDLRQLLASPTREPHDPELQQMSPHLLLQMLASRMQTGGNPDVTPHQEMLDGQLPLRQISSTFGDVPETPQNLLRMFTRAPKRRLSSTPGGSPRIPIPSRQLPVNGQAPLPSSRITANEEIMSPLQIAAASANLSTRRPGLGAEFMDQGQNGTAVYAEVTGLWDGAERAVQADHCR
ncbi:hypothetical protein HK097_009636 [Rhizophlyctis rosea]|uniref:Uncharacterized protein n=1 Tax=Rhizophlyctis rosea TaxID=64517 RepID=A0AAD5S8M8_9FUNG|nr:hypothetical protein HK097_009636 [Rhizophlyctis rosea]